MMQQPTMTTQTWVVALEVDEDPDGPDLDVKAVARTMDAVAGIHPSGRGGRRHSFLVRLDGRDAADALVTAVTRFREAPVAGGALLGARVVRPDRKGRGGLDGVDGVGSVEGIGGAGLRAVLRPRILAAIACVLLGAAALFALAPGGDAGSGNGAGSAKGGASRSDNGNLVANGSFEQAAVRSRGLARGVTLWGDGRAALVDNPVHGGERAQRLDVDAGKLGGVWLEAPAVGGWRYEQSAWVQVQTLAPGARAEMIVEWYGAESNLLDYQTLPLTTTDSAYVRRVQTASAPAGTVRARFLVNFRGGGSLLIDDAELRSSSATPTTSGPAPAPGRSG